MIDAGVIPEDSRVELIEGVIVAVSPQSPEHVHAVTTLLRILNRALGDEWRVRAQSPLTLLRSEPEPDIAVVRRELEDAAVRHPTTASLVVEVAKTSLALDRAMATSYAEAGVQEYWIVNVDLRQVEVFRRPEQGRFAEQQTATSADVLAPHALDVTIPVAALFRSGH